MRGEREGEYSLNQSLPCLTNGPPLLTAYWLHQAALGLVGLYIGAHTGPLLLCSTKKIPPPPPVTAIWLPMPQHPLLQKHFFPAPGLPRACLTADLHSFTTEVHRHLLPLKITATTSTVCLEINPRLLGFI